MKLSRKLILPALLLPFASALATEYPLLTSYDELAQKLITQTQSAQTDADWASIRLGTEELVLQGVSVMQLYASKNPVCTEQFNQFISEVPQMETLALPAVHARYHNGEGLAVAPKHCYLGRSQVVHPVMNIIRMKEAVTDETRAEIVADFDEVIEHTARIQKNLDTPPQI